MAESKVSVKLLIDTNSQKVLLAEAGKDFVDFLFHIFHLPVATIVALLKKQGMVGSLGKLYDSIEKLNEAYLQSDQSKNAILNPVVRHCGTSVPLLQLNDVSTEKKFYCCPNTHHKSVTDDPRVTCPSCNRQMTDSLTYIAPPPAPQGRDEGGYVKGLATYMVMDDLEVKPMSTISSITLLKASEVQDFGSLEERVVNLGMAEAVDLLKASLQSSQVLTDVFMKRAATSSQQTDDEFENFVLEECGCE